MVADVWGKHTSTYGVKANAHSGVVQAEVTMDGLYKGIGS